jgi:hypothetical protein
LLIINSSFFLAMPGIDPKVTFGAIAGQEATPA